MQSSQADYDEEAEQEDEYYVVEEALDIKSARCQVLFVYLKWKGYSDADNTWEPITNLNPEAALSICRGLKENMRKCMMQEKSKYYQKKLDFTRKAIKEWKSLLRKSGGDQDVDSSLSHHDDDLGEDLGVGDGKLTGDGKDKAENVKTARNRKDLPQSTKGQVNQGVSVVHGGNLDSYFPDKKKPIGALQILNLKTGSEKSDKSGAQGVPAKNPGAGINSNANTTANGKGPGYNLVRDSGDADKAETFKPKNLKHSPHSVSTSTGKATPKNKAGSANPFSPHSTNQKSLNSKEKERFPNSTTNNKTSNYLQDEIKSKVFEETNFEDEALSDYTIRKKPATYKEQEITQQPKKSVTPDKIDHGKFGGHYPPPPPPSILGSNQANNKPGNNFQVSANNA